MRKCSFPVLSGASLTACLMLAVSLASCKEPEGVRSGRHTLPARQSGADSVSAVRVCRSSSSLLALSPHLRPPEALRSSALSLLSGAEPPAFIFSKPSLEFHIDIKVPETTKAWDPQGLEIRVEGRSAESSAWDQDMILPLYHDPTMDFDAFSFQDGNYSGFFKFTSPVTQVRVFIQGKGAPSLFEAEVRAFEAPADLEFSLAGGGYLPKKYTRKPVGFDIIPRSAWGATPVSADKLSFGSLKWIVVHHSAVRVGEGSQCASHVQSYQRSHIRDQKMVDLGYHFLVCPDGRVFEGREGGKGVKGSHTFGLNDETIGIAFIGQYSERANRQNGLALDRPTTAALESGARLVAWLSKEYGIALDEKAHLKFTQAGQLSDRLTIHEKLASITSSEKGGSYGWDCPGDQIISRLPKLRADAIKYAADYDKQEPVPALPEPVIAEPRSVSKGGTDDSKECAQ